MPYRCDGDHEDCTGVTTLVTSLQDGEVLAFCPPYLLGWAEGLLKALDYTVLPPPPVPDGAGEAPSLEAVPAPQPAPAKSDQDPPEAIPAALTAPESPFPDPARDIG